MKENGSVVIVANRKIDPESMDKKEKAINNSCDTRPIKWGGLSSQPALKADC